MFRCWCVMWLTSLTELSLGHDALPRAAGLDVAASSSSDARLLGRHSLNPQAGRAPKAAKRLMRSAVEHANRSEDGLSAAAAPPKEAGPSQIRLHRQQLVVDSAGSLQALPGTQSSTSANSLAAQGALPRHVSLTGLHAWLLQLRQMKDGRAGLLQAEKNRVESADLQVPASAAPAAAAPVVAPAAPSSQLQASTATSGAAAAAAPPAAAAAAVAPPAVLSASPAAAPLAPLSATTAAPPSSAAQQSATAASTTGKPVEDEGHGTLFWLLCTLGAVAVAFLGFVAFVASRSSLAQRPTEDMYQPSGVRPRGFYSRSGSATFSRGKDVVATGSLLQNSTAPEPQQGTSQPSASALRKSKQHTAAPGPETGQDENGGEHLSYHQRHSQMRMSRNRSPPAIHAAAAGTGEGPSPGDGSAQAAGQRDWL